jgi:hypothetical protein
VVDTLLDDASAVLQSVVDELAPGVVAAIDVNEVVQRLDVQAIIDRVDLEALLDRIDVNDVADRIDLNRLVARLDMNAVLERIDLAAVIEHTPLGSIVARTSAGVIGAGADLMRSGAVGVDAFLHRWADRVLRRKGPPPAGPPLLVDGARRSPA